MQIMILNLKSQIIDVYATKFYIEVETKHNITITTSKTWIGFSDKGILFIFAE